LLTHRQTKTGKKHYLHQPNETIRQQQQLNSNILPCCESKNKKTPYQTLSHIHYMDSKMSDNE